MATVFTIFKLRPYTFLKIVQSTVRGDAIIEETELTGVFKARNGRVQNGNMESIDSSATLHVRPEDFTYTSPGQFVGNGIRVDDQDYAIVGATAGTNFATGEIEHYRLTLQTAKYTKAANGSKH